MSRRLVWLLGLMLLLAMVRFLVRPSGEVAGVAVVPALDHAPRPAGRESVAASIDAPAVASSFGASMSRLESDADEPRNAFEVRLPPAPPKPVSMATRAVAAPPVAGPAPVAPPRSSEPPAPSLHVIGTWTDAQGPSIFVASAGRVIQARAGELLLSDYRVMQIDASQVLLRDVRAEREIRLALPVPTTPLR